MKTKDELDKLVIARVNKIFKNVTEPTAVFPTCIGEDQQTYYANKTFLPGKPAKWVTEPLTFANEAEETAFLDKMVFATLRDWCIRTDEPYYRLLSQKAAERYLNEMTELTKN